MTIVKLCPLQFKIFLGLRINFNKKYFWRHKSLIVKNQTKSHIMTTITRCVLKLVVTVLRIRPFKKNVDRSGPLSLNCMAIFLFSNVWNNMLFSVVLKLYDYMIVWSVTCYVQGIRLNGQFDFFFRRACFTTRVRNAEWATMYDY